MSPDVVAGRAPQPSGKLRQRATSARRIGCSRARPHGNAAADRVKAEFNNGVLTIEVPKAEQAKPKAISIK